MLIRFRQLGLFAKCVREIMPPVGPTQGNLRLGFHIVSGAGTKRDRFALLAAICSMLHTVLQF